MTEKPRLVEVKDASEIEAVQRNGIDDVIGEMRPDGFAFCYRWSVERYRKQLLRASSSPSGPR